MGGPVLGTGSFGNIYEQAIILGQEDPLLLNTPVYPYKLNSLHYFALTANVQGI